MRILMIIDGLPGGGAEKVVLTLAKGLQEQGHMITLLSLRNVCEYTLPAGITYEVIEDHCHHPFRKLTELRRRARQLDAAVARHEQHGAFDVICSHLHKTDRIVALSRRLPKNNTWFCLHGVFSTSYLGHRQGISRWLKKRKIQKVYQHRNVVAVSRYVLNDLQQTFQVSLRRGEVIYNPFNIEDIRLLAQQPCERAGQDFIVHVGRFHPNKRHDRLIRAWAKSGLPASLVLLGKGTSESTERLKTLAESLGVAERLIFKGFTDNPYPWIQHAKMLVVSSDSEGFGNVLVESLICDTPIVSTRCPGGPEEIMTGDLARGLAPMNDEGLAEVMRDIYQHPPSIDPAILKQYSLDDICQRWLALAKPDKEHQG